MRKCSNCVKSVTDDEGMFCRARPPQAIPIVGEVSRIDPRTKEPVRNPDGTFDTMVATVGFKVMFPQVHPDMWCAEHSAIVLANENDVPKEREIKRFT